MGPAHRELFGDEHSQRRRRRDLIASILAAGVATGSALVLELAPTPDWLDVVAVAFACAAIVLAAHTALRTSRTDRARLEAAVETIDMIGSMVVVIDRTSRIRLANPAACAVFGRSEDALLGRRIQEAVFAEVDRAASHAAFAAIMAGEVDPRGHRSTRRIERPDGTTRAVSWHVTPHDDDSGQVLSLLLSGEDVTAAEARDAVRTRERADLLELHALAQDVAALDDARPAVVERVRRLTDASFVGLCEPVGDGSGDWVYTNASSDGLAGRHLRADEPSGSLIVADSREPLFVSEARGDPRVAAGLVRATGVRSLLFQPVIVGEEAVAVITAGWLEPASHLDDRKELLMGLAAGETAIALQRAKTLDQLRTAALVDPLTAIANRRAFDQELARSLARASRSGDALTLVVFDLNGFKALNDRRGHDAGDAVLSACATAWADQLRRGDLLARLGGDEFAAILPACDAATLGGLLGRLRAATPHAAGVAIGAATWDGGSPEALYRRADRALYADKTRSGVVAPDAVPG